MGSRIGVPMLSSPNQSNDMLFLVHIEPCIEHTKQHAVASMDADIERSNGHIIEVSSRNIDAYIFVVL